MLADLTARATRAARSSTALTWLTYYAWVGVGLTVAALNPLEDRYPWWVLALGFAGAQLLTILGSIGMAVSERIIERRVTETADVTRAKLAGTLDAYRSANQSLIRDVEELKTRLALAYDQLDEALRINHKHVNQAILRAQNPVESPTAAASLTTEGDTA